MPAFDAYIAVDWSAANSPKSGKDSIWISERDASGSVRPSENPPTRAAAMSILQTRIEKALAKGERLFIGFDFPFGYPTGAAKRIAGKPFWSALWRTLDQMIADDEFNVSSRFEAAGDLNARLSDSHMLFWGHPAKRSYSRLGPKRDALAYGTIAERRLVETVAKKAQPVWKLNGAGCVGGQALLGIPRLEKLRSRFGAHIAVWPFETGFAHDLSRPVILAEIYPSLVKIDPRIEPKDRAQVEAFTQYLWDADRTDGLARLLSAPDSLTDAERQRVLSEEGWIVGAGLSPQQSQAPVVSKGCNKSGSLDYLSDPAEIYRRSFEIVEAEADLARFSQMDRQVAIRMIHACGQVEIAENLIFSANASESGSAALAAGKAIFCDSTMVGAGIIKSRLMHDNAVICTLDEDGVAEAAQRGGTTRSAAAVDLWDERLDGAIAVFGNAPTALFRLLERIDEGGPKPALIIGLPVGFVGASESKAELIADSRDIPYLTLTGRLGGSAMASAAVNALAGMAWPRQ